jgi:O-antigen/teichoic acid export membrane protein
MEKSKGPVDLTTAKVIADTFFVSLSWIAITILKPIRAIVFGRVLGPHLYGIMNIATPYIQILTLTSNIGFNDAMTRLIPGYLHTGSPTEARRVFRAAAVMTLLLSLVWTVLLLLLTGPILRHWAHQPDAFVPFSLYALIIPFLALNTFYAVVFIAFQRGKTRAKITFLYGLLNLILPIAAVLWRRNINHVIITFVASEGLGTLFFALFFRKEIAPRLRGGAGKLRSGIREIFSTGYLFFFAQLGWNLIISLDRIMIKFFMEARFLGFYTLGTLIVTALERITSTAGMALVPSLSAARAAGDFDVYERQVRNVSRLGFIALAPIAFCIYAIAGDVTGVVLPKFMPAVPVIQILVFIAILDLPCRIGRASLVACGRGGLLTTGYIVVAAWNFVWNWILIPRFGMEGAAYASLSSFLLLAITLQVMMRKTSGTSVWVRHALYPVALSLVYPLLHVILPLGETILRPIVVLFGASALYLFLTLLTGLVRRDDLVQARESLAPRGTVPHVRLTILAIEFLERVRRGLRGE